MYNGMQCRKLMLKRSATLLLVSLVAMIHINMVKHFSTGTACLPPILLWLNSGCCAMFVAMTVKLSGLTRKCCLNTECEY